MDVQIANEQRRAQLRKHLKERKERGNEAEGILNLLKKKTQVCLSRSMSFGSVMIAVSDEVQSEC